VAEHAVIETPAAAEQRQPTAEVELDARARPRDEAQTRERLVGRDVRLMRLEVALEQPLRRQRLIREWAVAEPDVERGALLLAWLGFHAELLASKDARRIYMPPATAARETPPRPRRSACQQRLPRESTLKWTWVVSEVAVARGPAVYLGTLLLAAVVLSRARPGSPRRAGDPSLIQRLLGTPCVVATMPPRSHA
jgi:hypothetical protein